VLAPRRAGGARLRRAARRAAVALPIAAVLACAGLLTRGLAGRPLLASVVPDEGSRVEVRYRAPVGAVRYLRASPYAGRLLNPFTAGEFLYWTLYPRFRVAIDGRYEEVYAQEQFLWVARFYTARDPARVVRLAEASTADFVLLRPGTTAFAALAASPQWSLVYDDGTWALAGRREVLARHPPFAFEGSLPSRPPSIADFFTAADRARYARYPR
jgi:hypothetical protein